MALYIPQMMTIDAWTFACGCPARGIHPDMLDRASTYLIGGCAHAYPIMTIASAEGETIAESPMRVPIMLPPWCGGVIVAVRAVCAVSDGSVTIGLHEWTEEDGLVQIDTGAVVLGPEALGVYGAYPASWAEWAGIPWTSAGSVATEPASGSGALVCAPANRWRTCYIIAAPDQAAIHDLIARPVPSMTPLDVGE